MKHILTRLPKGTEIGRPVLTKADIYEEMAPFFKVDSNSKKFRDQMDRSISGIEKMKLLREVKDQPGHYYIERIIKAKIPADALEEIKQTLKDQVETEDELTI